MRNYLLSFLLFIILISAGTYLLSMNKVMESDLEIVTVRWWTLGYFSVITVLFHLGLVSASKGKPQVFIRYYMGATSFKLLIHLGAILIFAFSFKALAVPFIISFIVYYFFFTAFEVGMNWRQFRR